MNIEQLSFPTENRSSSIALSMYLRNVYVIQINKKPQKTIMSRFNSRKQLSKFGVGLNFTASYSQSRDCNNSTPCIYIFFNIFTHKKHEFLTICLRTNDENNAIFANILVQTIADNKINVPRSCFHIIFL